LQTAFPSGKDRSKKARARYQHRGRALVQFEDGMSEWLCGVGSNISSQFEASRRPKRNEDSAKATVCNLNLLLKRLLRLSPLSR
jgi:hypothetical protein